MPAGYLTKLFLCISSHSNVFYKNAPINFAEFTGKYLSRSLFLTTLQTYSLQLYLKGTLVLAFSCKFWEIFQNSFFTEHLRTAAAVQGQIPVQNSSKINRTSAATVTVIHVSLLLTWAGFCPLKSDKTCVPWLLKGPSIIF